MNREVKVLIRELQARGFYVTQASRGGHYAVRSERGKRVATLPSSPSDWRARRNMRANLRRAGVLPR